MSLQNTSISFDLIQPGEEERVVDLISHIFNEFVAPQFSPEGVAEFMKYVRTDALAERIEAGNTMILAKIGRKIVGAIEVAGNNHIALLFVDKANHRKGIGRELLRKAIETCKTTETDIDQITVNSSPNAVSAYRKMGFEIVEKEQIKNGIRFVRMELSLA